MVYQPYTLAAHLNCQYTLWYMVARQLMILISACHK